MEEVGMGSKLISGMPLVYCQHKYVIHTHNGHHHIHTSMTYMYKINGQKFQAILNMYNHKTKSIIYLIFGVKLFEILISVAMQHKRIHTVADIF